MGNCFKNEMLIKSRDELITYQELVALGRGLKILPFLKDFTLKIKG